MTIGTRSVRSYPKCCVSKIRGGFSQRRPNGTGGWIHDLIGVRRVPYRLPELIRAATEQRIWVTEGEADCERLRSLGAIATTNSGGAGKWADDFAEYFHKRPVIILPDNDAPGKAHAFQVAQSLSRVAASVRVLKLPGLVAKGDVSDWIDAGGTLVALNGLADTTAEFEFNPPTTSTWALTDVGNAERFADLFAKQFRYVGEWDRWIYYDGKRWAPDAHGSVMRAAIDTVRQLHTDAGSLTDSAERTDLARHALRSESARALRALIEIAKTDRRITIPADQLDNSARTCYLLNVDNGTIDVRTGEIMSHNPEDFITRLAPINFDATASLELWETFLERILPDPEVRAFVQRYAGSALTGDTADQCFVLFHGIGANGKSTLENVLLGALGDYGRQADFETFLHSTGRSDRRGAARSDLVALRGKRLVSAIEASDGQRLNESLVKSLTGSDALTARGNYERNDSTFTPELHLMLSTNELPRIHGDTAIWRRVLVVEFPVTIPEHERDTTLFTRLTSPANLAGVLNWCLIGARDWYDTGDTNRLRPPDAVRMATATYRNDQDVLARFFEDCCDLDPSAWTATKELRAVYGGWAEAAGERALGESTLRQKLRARGLKPDRRGTPAQRGWSGIRLTGWLPSRD